MDRIQELTQRVAKLEDQVKKLVEYIEERKRSQLKLPLDETSQNIIKRYQTF